MFSALWKFPAIGVVSQPIPYATQKPLEYLLYLFSLFFSVLSIIHFVDYTLGSAQIRLNGWSWGGR